MNTTQVRYQRRHMADLAAGLRLSRAQLSREHGPRAELVRHQQQRLEVVVRHAATHSPFYRRQVAETGALGDGPVQLTRLPVLDKPLLMEHFDELVCDPRLRRDELLEWVGRMTRDQLYLNRYRVMLTSGSSGRPGLYVYDAAGWRSIFAGLAAQHRPGKACGPTLPRQRMAFVGAADPSHISRQGATMASGLHRVLALPVTLPLPQLVEALNEFQPSYLQVYPSAAMWLVDEQHAGRLRISPRILVTVAELRTAEMTQRLPGAFGVRPYDLLRLHRGAVRIGVRAPPGNPPVRGHHPRRERRRRRTAGAAWPARRPAAGHQLVQPGPAAAPTRGDGLGHYRPGSLPLRTHSRPDEDHLRP